MPLSILDPHPVGVQNPVVLRATAVLPASPTWDAAPTEIPCSGFWWCRPYFEYTRGNQSGAMEYRYEVSPYSADQVGIQSWFHGTLYVPETLIPCRVVSSNVQQEVIEYCAVTANLETWVGPPIHLAGCVERIRLSCRESGNVDWPGTARVIGVFYIEG